MSTVLTKVNNDDILQTIPLDSADSAVLAEIPPVLATPAIAAGMAAAGAMISAFLAGAQIYDRVWGID